MAAISLDDIIPYQPPAIKLPRNSKLPQAPSFIFKHSDLLPSDGSYPPHGPPHDVPPYSAWDSDLSLEQFPCPQNPRSTVIESHTSPPDSGLHTDAVSARLSGLDSGWPNTHDEHNDRITLSTSHLASGDGRVQVLSGKRERYMDDHDFHKHQGSEKSQSFPSQGQIWSEFHELSPQPLILGQTHGPGLPAPEEISVERTKKFSVADQVKIKENLVRQIDTALDLANGTTTVYDHGSAISNPRSRSPRSVSQPCDIQPDSPNITEVPNSREPPIWILGDTTEAEDSNIIPITSGDSVVDSATNEGANDDYECGAHRSVEHSLAFSEDGPSTWSVSPPPQNREKGWRLRSPGAHTGFCHTPKPSSAVQPDRNSRDRVPIRSLSRQQNSCFGKRKTQSDPIYDDSSDDLDDPDDGDYVDNHPPKSHARGASSQPTRQLRQSATRHAPTRIQYKASPHSTVDATQFDHSGDKTHPTSLQDTETIPVRGFLTRQMFLSKIVYSFTFEEERSNTCSHEWDKASAHSQNKLDTRYSKHNKPKKSRVSNTTTGTIYSNEDDQILIELKEKQKLSWSRIAEHFPGRSKGSLEVHYCTKLKGRPDGSSGQRSNTQKRSATRSSSSKICRRSSRLPATSDSDVLSRRRYGPSRARQTVSRYSPV